MKRLFAIMAFVAGGLCAELATPLNCSLITSTRTRQRTKHHE